ncbi:branched-chain amino acid ABC transporter permease [Variovorax sp. V118]|uniref:branched-chain amino acid ABC transporter permease n=1 Tax=Variovorax sp. V118 TaxID=3065954 RepID=UPI0034E83E60
MSLSFFTQLIISGLTVGSVYALVAVGFTLIYSASDVFNFAQGEFVMLGGVLTAAAISSGTPYWAAAIVGIAGAVVVGFLLNLLVIRPAKDASPIILLILTIGASVFIRGITSVIFGKDFVKLPALFDVDSWQIAGATVQVQGVAIIVAATAVVTVLWVFLTSTQLGKAVRATSSNRLASILVGISPSAIVGLSFAVSALIGAVGGILLTPLTLMSYDSGTLLAIKGFAGAMLGGMGHPAGPLVGALLVGLIEAFGAGYISSAYKDVFTFLVLLLVLGIRPHGLLGGDRVERV